MKFNLQKFNRLKPKKKKTVLKEVVNELIKEEEISQSAKKSQIKEAIRFIEGYESDTHFEKTRKVLEEQIALTKDPEEQGTGYYYLLRLLLRGHLFFENKEARELYQLMRKSFLACEKFYEERSLAAKQVAEKTKIRCRLQNFYQLADSYFLTLEQIYIKKGFRGARDRTHEDKMHFRKRYHFAMGSHFKHFAHFFLDKTSRYGHSFARWGITVIIFITIFGGIFATLDYLSDYTMFRNYPYRANFFDYFYFSAVTFTTLGYGDLVPATIPEKIVASIEVMLGFIMLGVFINLIQRRF